MVGKENTTKGHLKLALTGSVDMLFIEEPSLQINKKNKPWQINFLFSFIINCVKCNRRKFKSKHWVLPRVGTCIVNHWLCLLVFKLDSLGFALHLQQYPGIFLQMGCLFWEHSKYKGSGEKVTCSPLLYILLLWYSLFTDSLIREVRERHALHRPMLFVKFMAAWRAEQNNNWQQCKLSTYKDVIFMAVSILSSLFALWVRFVVTPGYSKERLDQKRTSGWNSTFWSVRLQKNAVLCPWLT